MKPITEYFGSTQAMTPTTSSATNLAASQAAHDAVSTAKHALEIRATHPAAANLAAYPSANPEANSAMSATTNFATNGLGNFTVKPGRQAIERRAAHCDQHGAFESVHIIRGHWTTCPACIEANYEAERRRMEEEQRGKRLRSWERRIGCAGIPERFHDRTFASYVVTTHEQQQALAVCEHYAQRFNEIGIKGASMLMCGRPGTGKTHLAVAIGLYVMAHFHSTVLFTTALRMLRRVKETYSRDSARSEAEAIAELVYPDLLIVDEVGVQFGSETERHIFFDVLNERYEKRKPAIFLSNKDIDGVKAFLGERVYDRLREDGSEYVSFTWDSYRGKEGA
jgi:DNA replication protein DnaC